jgi:DNA-binding transcriptional regulator YiaG
MDFDELVKQIRSTLKLTQEQLAQDLKVSVATLNRWENDHYTPSRLARMRIVEYCKENGIPNEIYVEMEKIR